MAGRPSQQPTTPRSNTPILRYIAIIFLTLIVLTGLIVFIAWLAINPKRLVYTIEKASLQNFNLSNNHLNSNFDFVLRSYNPNKKVSVYYDSFHVLVAFSDENLASGWVQPFFQRRGNVTRLDVNLKAENVGISGPAAKDLGAEKSTGEIALDVWIKAKIRFNVGVWKSGHRTLRISCNPVVHVSRPRRFERTKCSVEL